MAHWVYIVVVSSGPAAFAVWRLTRAFLLIVGGLTKDPQRSKQCEKMFILSRGDAKEILKSLAESPEKDEPPPSGADQAGTDSGSSAPALEAVPVASAAPASS
jgi:hypothetical protein